MRHYIDVWIFINMFFGRVAQAASAQYLLRLSRKLNENEPKETPYQAARLRLVTPIYHAEASAQAEALATAATGGQSAEGQQAQRSGCRLGHLLPASRC